MRIGSPRQRDLRSVLAFQGKGALLRVCSSTRCISYPKVLQNGSLLWTIGMHRKCAEIEPIKCSPKNVLLRAALKISSSLYVASSHDNGSPLQQLVPFRRAEFSRKSDLRGLRVLRQRQSRLHTLSKGLQLENSKESVSPILPGGVSHNKESGSRRLWLQLGTNNPTSIADHWDGLQMYIQCRELCQMISTAIQH